jgi:DNA-binding XRE family transcriptional regulator/predicted GIY-YIG superfamily endonuclease
MTTETKGYTVYRLYDAERNPLYVGVTNRGTRRIKEHSLQKEWWSAVDQAAFEHFETLGEALDAEAAQIRSLRPQHNRNGLAPAANDSQKPTPMADVQPVPPKAKRTSAKKLKRLRRGRGLTQRELSDASKVAQSTIAHIESGARKEPHPGTLRKLARVLDVEIAELLED